MRDRIFLMSLTLLISFAASGGTESHAAQSSDDSILSETWTGLYGGVHLGYDKGTSRFSISPEGLTTTHPSIDFVTQAAKGTDHSNRASNGLQIGYRQQFGNFVTGVQTDWSNNRSRGGIQNARIFDTRGNYATSEGAVDIDWISTLRMIVGYASDVYFIYVAPGISLASTQLTNRVRFKPIFQNPEPTILNDSRAKQLTFGSAISAGVEYRLNESWSVALEYTRANLGKAEAKSTSPAYEPRVNLVTPADYIHKGEYVLRHKATTTLDGVRLSVNYLIPH